MFSRVAPGKPANRRAEQRLIRYNWQIDHDAKVALLKDLGRDINKYYGGIDRLFEKALDLLKTEEPQIDARLAKLALAVPRGTPELDLGLKRKLDQLEDAAGSERVLAKRRQ